MELHQIKSKIYDIRGQKVMIDRDLAEVYGVETRVLNQAVKRNIERFPADFMFQLTDIEFQYWKSQIVITNTINMGLRHRPYAFTELGVSMLSSVLNSKTAIQINMGIMRAFVSIRHALSNKPVAIIAELHTELKELKAYNLLKNLKSKNMTHKESIERNIGLTFDFVNYLMDNKEELEKLPDSFGLEFLEKDFLKIEHRQTQNSTNSNLQQKYVRVRNSFVM